MAVRHADPSAAASSDRTGALEYPASGETQDRPGSLLVQKSGHVDDDVQISALDAFYEMDGRKSRYIGEVLDWYRGEDARYLKRSELNELIENLTSLNALEWKVQNGVMNDKFVKNFVMNAKIDPKVVMDLSTYKIGGWNSLQHSKQKLLEEFIDEKETWVVDRNSKQRSTLCDTVLGTKLCEFGSAHEEIDVTS